MTIDASAAILAQLQSHTVRPVWTIELALAAGTLYYSSTNFTWSDHPDNGTQGYTALAVNARSIVEHIRDKIPTTTLRFSNVQNTLQDKIEPVDLLKNKRCLIRLLLRDSSDNLLTDYIDMFTGTMEKPEKVDQDTFEVKVQGLAAGFNTRIPSRRLTPNCNWEYQDGVNCNSTSGEASCARTFEDCEIRNNTHEFGGFRAATQIARLTGFNLLFSDFNVPEKIFPTPETPRDEILAIRSMMRQFSSKNPVPYADPTKVVPVVYGRRRITGEVIETATGPQDDILGSTFDIELRAISDGEIESIEQWFKEDQERGGLYEDDGTGTGTQRLSVGFWYRLGLIGVNGTDTDANLSGGSISRPQNIDPLGVTPSPYSRTAYTTFVQGPLQNEERSHISDMKFDVKGVKVFTWTAGVKSGSTVYSVNPVWQIVDLLLSKRYGLGHVINEADINFTDAEAAATYCDSLDDHILANTTTSDAIIYDAVTDLTWIRIVNPSGFGLGMTCEVNNDPARVGEIFKVVNLNDGRVDDDVAVVIVRGSAVGTGGSGIVVKGQVKRFESHINLKSARSSSIALGKILDAFRGYMTYSGGLISIKAERDVAADSGHFTDVSFNSGYGIVRDSFTWNTKESSRDRDLNRVVVRFISTESDVGEDEGIATNWTNVAADGMREKILVLDSVSNIDQAKRLADLELKRVQDLKTGARFDVGPVGLLMQPGDKILVTHDVPGWSAVEKRIVQTEKNFINRLDSLVRITVEDYSGSIYGVAATDLVQSQQPPSLIVTLSSDLGRDGRVRLHWVTNVRARVSRWDVYKSDNPFEINPVGVIVAHPRFRVATLPSGVMNYTYEAEPSEMEQLLYFVVAARVELGDAVSNQLAIRPSDIGSRSIPINLVHGGDFQDPIDWEVIDPTIANRYPEFDQAEQFITDGPFANPTNVSDGDPLTYSNGTWAVTPPYTSGHEWSGFIPSGTAVGRFFINCQIGQDQSSKMPKGELIADYDASTFVRFAQLDSRFGFRSSGIEFRSGVVSINSSKFVRVRSLPADTQGVYTGESRVHLLRFEEMSGAPWGSVGSNKLTLESDGVSWAQASRPFPWNTPRSVETLLKQDSENTLRIALKRTTVSDVVNGDIEVALYSPALGTYWTILRINDSDTSGTPANRYSDIVDDWTHYRTRFVPTSDINGAIQVVIRTMSTNPIDIDRLAFYRGPTVFDWRPTNEEMAQGYHGDESSPEPDPFNREQLAAGPLIYQRVLTS